MIEYLQLYRNPYTICEYLMYCNRHTLGSYVCTAAYNPHA